MAQNTLGTQDNNTTQSDIVKEALSAYKADSNGKVIIPDNATPEVVTALKLEQRRRDSEKGYYKELNERKRLEAQVEALKQSMAEVVTAPTSLTPEQVAELEELKLVDPEKWYERRQALENINKQQAQERVATTVSRATKTAEEMYAQQQAQSREKTLNELLAHHNAVNPDRPITKDMLELNIPPILVNKFTQGQLDGEGFLNEASKFLYAGTTIKQAPQANNEPNLGNIAGGSKPTKEAESQDLASIYAGI